MPVDLVKIGLALLDFACKSDGLERVLRPIAGAIGEAAEYLESLSEEQVEYAQDEELDAIENLLGVAFVACQAHMSGVLSRIVRLDTHVKNKTSLGVEILGPHEHRNVLLGRACSERIGTYTKTEVLWSLANFYKHRDEFPRPWSNADRRTKLTVDVITAAGLSEGSTGNLRTGAQALGVSEYTNLDVLIELVDDWSDSLRDDVREMLKR